MHHFCGSTFALSKEYSEISFHAEVYKHLKNNLDKTQTIQKESRTVLEDRARIKSIRKKNNYFGWLAVTCLSSFRNSDSRGYTLVSSMYYNIIEEWNWEFKRQKHPLGVGVGRGGGGFWGKWCSTLYKSSLCNILWGTFSTIFSIASYKEVNEEDSI